MSDDLPRITEWINARFHATVYEDAFSPFCLIASNRTDVDDDQCLSRGLLPGEFRT